MNDYQVCRQIKYLVEKITWPDGSKVFQRALITPIDLDNVLKVYGTPVCLIRPIGATAKEDRPEEILAEYELGICVSVGGDQTGEGSMIGRDSNLGDWDGKGLLQIQSKLLKALCYLTEKDGIKFQFLAAGLAVAERVGTVGNYISRNVSFSARIQILETYPEPTNLIPIGGSGSAALSWDLPPDRYDRKKIVVRRSTGSAPTSPTSGSSVTLSGDLPTSVVDSGLAPATYYYSAFCAYDEEGKGIEANYIYSDPWSRSVVVS